MKFIWHHRMIVFIAVAAFALAACSTKEDAAKPQAAAQDQPAAEAQAQPAASDQQVQEQAQSTEATSQPAQEQMQSEAAQDQPAQEQAQSDEAVQPNEQVAGEAAQQAQKLPPTSIPEVLEITGKVEKTDEGIVIVTNMANYYVLGRNLTDMVGQTVNVTGAVEESGGRYTINVMSVTETE